jgi:hypothetical protein
MKTHEIAKALAELAQALGRAPDIEIRQLLSQKSASRINPNPSDIPIALSALVALSRFDKDQWRAVIKEYSFPIEVRPTESNRDVLGKILRHLEKDPNARQKMKAAAQRSRSDVSPELMNALNFLLK